MSKKTDKKTRNENKIRVPIAVVHIYAAFNNTLITVSDPNGNCLVSQSAGFLFPNSKKSTPFAAEKIAQQVAALVWDVWGVRSVTIRIKGPGAGRDSAIRGIAKGGLIIHTIKDVTSIPHNGVRPPKRRKM